MHTSVLLNLCHYSWDSNQKSKNSVQFTFSQFWRLKFIRSSNFGLMGLPLLAVVALSLTIFWTTLNSLDYWIYEPCYHLKASRMGILMASCINIAPNCWKIFSIMVRWQRCREDEKTDYDCFSSQIPQKLEQFNHQLDLKVKMCTLLSNLNHSYLFVSLPTVLYLQLNLKKLVISSHSNYHKSKQRKNIFCYWTNQFLHTHYEKNSWNQDRHFSLIFFIGDVTFSLFSFKYSHDLNNGPLVFQ